MRLDDLLLEANVLNTDEIKKYLETMAKDIPQPYQKQFIKAAFTDITNNPDYHTPIKELPDNAPQWAEKALAAGDLVSANVSQGQTELLSQVLHWLQDIIEKSKSTTSGELEVADKREATKQLQSLTRMTLADMLRQERSWFARHANLVKGDVSGMEKVMDVGNGFSWWLLVTQEAFTREGQTLKNCIGTNYTASNTKASGTKIYILKDRSLESVVAMRIVHGQMEEVKGHNNKPPVAAYIPYVNTFIQKENITIDSRGSWDLTNAGYTWNPSTKSITHITEAYPYEFGPELKNNMILAKWTAPGNMKTYGFEGHSSVKSVPGDTRWDVVSKRNTYHPRLTLNVNDAQKTIVGIGNLPNPNRTISEKGMKMLAELLDEVCAALKVKVDSNLTGDLNRPKLNRYGLIIKDGKIETDYALAADVSVSSNPESISTIANPSERLQMIAVTKQPDVLTAIDNPTEAVQIKAIQTSKSPHALMNKFIEKREGELPSQAVQLAAVERDGLAIEKIIPASEDVQLAAVNQDGDAIVWLAYNSRKFKVPPPSVAVQNAAIRTSQDALRHLLMYKIPVDMKSKVLAINTWKRDPYSLSLVKDALEEYDQMTPELEQLINSAGS